MLARQRWHCLTATASGARADFILRLHCTVLSNAQNPLHTFPRRQLVTDLSFNMLWLVALLQTCYGEVVNLLRLLEIVSWCLYCAANIGFLSSHAVYRPIFNTKTLPPASDTSTDNLFFLRAFYKHKVKEKAQFLPFLASNHELLDTQSFFHL